MEEIKNKTNLASNQENGKKEHGVFALVAAAVVLLFFGSFAWISINKLNKNTNSGPQPSADRDYCRQDSDCVLADEYSFNLWGQSSCCPELNCDLEAVNIETKEKETKARDEYCGTKDYQCPVSKPCGVLPKRAVCKQGHCVAEKEINNININSNSGVESPTGIYLEQKEYKRGEKITGVVRNSGDFDIKIANIGIEKLSLSDCDASVGNVETKDCVQREWKTIKYHIGCACGEAVKCEGTNIKAQAHNIYGFSWGQETNEVDLIPDSCKTAGAGTYRVKASYREIPNLPPGAVSEQQIEQIMYSKEFFIIDESASQLLNNNSF